MPLPFFAPDSFWNTPLPANCDPHPEQDRFLDLTRWSTGSAGLHINLHAWTVPIYEAGPGAPRRPVGRRLHEDAQGRMFLANSRPFLEPGRELGHHPDFNSGGGVPIPPHAESDSQEDGHLAVVSPSTGEAWDMWAARRAEDGAWRSCTGMAYRLDGPGVFSPGDFPARNGESIHLYGPSRATGVPAIAGMIRHADVVEGRIAHKLSFAMKASGLLSHYFPPALWTDGGVPGGVPAGTVLRLDPSLALDAFALSPGAKVVARALQEFGAVLVDFADGFTVAGEGLWRDPEGRSWHGTLEEDALFPLGFEHFQFLAPEPLGQRRVEKGMVPFPHGPITAAYRHHTGIHS